jgi:hypothetical protein
MENSTDLMTKLDESLHEFLFDVESWKNSQTLGIALPSTLKSLWLQLQELRLSSAEAVRITQRWSRHQSVSDFVDPHFVEAAVGTIRTLQAEFHRLKIGIIPAFSVFDVRQYEKMRRDLMLCNCQIQCLLEGFSWSDNQTRYFGMYKYANCVNSAAIVDIRHQSSQSHVVDTDEVCAGPARRIADNAGSKNSPPRPQSPVLKGKTLAYSKKSRVLTFGKLRVTAQYILTTTCPRKCYDHCTCSCHGRTTEKGEILDYTSLRPFRRGSPVQYCTDRRCRKLQLKKRQIVIQLTDCVMKEYAFAVISRGSRMNFELKCRPIVPGNSDSIRFCQEGEFESLKELVISGRVSPYETSADGWSLLHVSSIQSRALRVTIFTTSQHSAYYSQLEIVKFLLDCGADLDAVEVKSR